jgi:hypothetical protein
MRRAPLVPKRETDWAVFGGRIRERSCGALQGGVATGWLPEKFSRRGSPHDDVPEWGLPIARGRRTGSHTLPGEVVPARTRRPAPAGLERADDAGLLRSAARPRRGFRRCDGARCASSRLSLRYLILAACAVVGPIGLAAVCIIEEY